MKAAIQSTGNKYKKPLLPASKTIFIGKIFSIDLKRDMGGKTPNLFRGFESPTSIRLPINVCHISSSCFLGKVKSHFEFDYYFHKRELKTKALMFYSIPKTQQEQEFWKLFSAEEQSSRCVQHRAVPAL